MSSWSLVSSEMPRLTDSHRVLDFQDPLPGVHGHSSKYKALSKVKVHKAKGPDNIPAWILGDFCHMLAPPSPDLNLSNSVNECRQGPGARLTKPWLLTIGLSLNCIEMNRRLLVNNDVILHSLPCKLGQQQQSSQCLRSFHRQ